MSLETHRAALVALLEAVPDIGVVHDHEPFQRTEAGFREAYVCYDGHGGTQIRGWFVQRQRTTETAPNTGRTIDAHTWRVRGFMSLDTAKGSELVFDQLVEAVRKAYRDDISLGGAASAGPLGQLSGFQVVDSGPVMLAGALCHSATLQITTYELLDDGE